MSVNILQLTSFPDGRMTADAAAAFLGFTNKTLAQWRVNGTGPRYVRLGGRIFYHLADLEEWARVGNDPSPAKATVSGKKVVSKKNSRRPNLVSTSA